MLVLNKIFINQSFVGIKNIRYPCCPTAQALSGLPPARRAQEGEWET